MKRFPFIVLLVALARTAVATDFSSLPFSSLPATSDTRIGDLLSASIIAAGDCQLQSQTRTHFNGLCERLRQRVEMQTTDEELARTVLMFMHEEILTGAYDPESYSVGQTLADGDYNCLTATILFCCLCETNNLDLTIVSAPGHVSVRLNDSSDHTIETTCSSWPSPKRSASTNVREISEAQLLARVYYNRGVYYARRHQFEAAVAALGTSIGLDRHHRAAIRNLAVTLNNWSLELCSQARFEDASKLVQRAHSVSKGPEFVVTGEYIFSRWVNDKLTHGQLDQAAAMLDAAVTIFPSSTVLKKLRHKLAKDLTTTRF